MERIKKFFKDEEGVTAIEYGLIAAIIALGILGAVTLAKDKLVAIFDAIAGLPVPS
jgi:pilus assembly protein Flp/PilA